MYFLLILNTFGKTFTVSTLESMKLGNLKIDVPGVTLNLKLLTYTIKKYFYNIQLFVLNLQILIEIS